MRKAFHGYILIAPVMIGCLVFTLIPFGIVLRYSFTQGYGAAGMFVGMEHYTKMFQNDLFRLAFFNTMKFLAIGLPLIMLGYMNLLNTYAALILPSIIVPLGTFILTQSFKSVPDTVLDAAMLDGCGVLRMLFYVVSPMNKSGLVCVLLLSFLDAWNMVEQPIAFLKEAEQYPISVALAYTPPSETSVQLVCCILVVLPALFLFTFFNRELVEGIVLAEVK